MKRTPTVAGRNAVEAVAAIPDAADRARIAEHVADEMERIRLEALGEAAKTMTLRQIGTDLLGGVSPQRADQIIKNARRGSTSIAAYAFRDTADDTVHGPWDALPDGAFSEGMLLFNPVSPSPFAGHTLTVRYGPWASGVNVYALHVHHIGADGGALVRDTVELHRILFPGR